MLVDGYNKLDINFSSVLDWCMMNKLTVNVGRTKHMIGHTPSDDSNVNFLHYNSQKIEIAREYSYLGVKLDNNLTMENHINKFVRQANKKISVS